MPACICAYPPIGTCLDVASILDSWPFFSSTATACNGCKMADDLFNIKNEFFLGNFQGAINEAQASDLVLSSPADEKDRDVIVRSLICGIEICMYIYIFLLGTFGRCS
jgi:hypothetical protein